LLSEVGTLVPKHVVDMSLMFIYIFVTVHSVSAINAVYWYNYMRNGKL